MLGSEWTVKIIPNAIRCILRSIHTRMTVKQRKHRDPASVSNAVSEDEPITMKEAVQCIKWFQNEYDELNNRHQGLKGAILVALAEDGTR
jgi:hypothetical protein